MDSSQIMEILKMHVSQMILLKSKFFVFNSEVVKIKSNAVELQSDNVKLEGEVSDMKEEFPELKLNNAEFKFANKKFKSEVWSTTKDIQCAKSLGFFFQEVAMFVTRDLIQLVRCIEKS